MLMSRLLPEHTDPTAQPLMVTTVIYPPSGLQEDFSEQHGGGFHVKVLFFACLSNTEDGLLKVKNAHV